MEASKPPGIGKPSWQIGQWEQRSVQSQGDRLVGAGIVRRITNSNNKENTFAAAGALPPFSRKRTSQKI